METLRGDGTEIELVENGLPFVTTLTQGQKTGWFYDQRDSRALLASLVSQFEEPKVFDGYCYAGGFAIAMATQGAQVTAVDRSGPALELAQQSAAMNEVELNCIKADVFNVLERPLKTKRLTIWSIWIRPLLPNPKVVAPRSAWLPKVNSHGR